MRFYFVSPAGHATGGTELLHQACQCLGELGAECYMIYPDMDKYNCPTPPSFLKYGVKYVECYYDAPDSVLVLAETQVHLIDQCQKGIPVIWWLSVDNYFHAYPEMITEEDIDPFHMYERENVLHFVQSQYAADFLQNALGIPEYAYLKDYINDDIFRIAENNQQVPRENICVYNPKKGYDNLKKIIEACREDIAWIPLVNMTPMQVAETMCRAKVYIDFGAHPGKDRIPREAAVCGCRVITNRLGSADYKEDVNIPDCFKIEDMTDIEGTLQVIYELVDRYEEHASDYQEYVNGIYAEKEEFQQDMRKVLRQILGLLSGRIFGVAEEKKEINRKTVQGLREILRVMDDYLENASENIEKGYADDAMNRLLDFEYMLRLTREMTFKEINQLKGE